MNDSARDKNRHHVAVYGTLKGMDRKGRGWANKKNSITFIGRAYTLFDNFEMHGGGFPVVNRGTGPNKGKVLVEIYEVDTETLRALDMYESAPNFYEAEPTAFTMEADGSDCIALMYYGRSVNTTLKNRPIIKPSSGVLYWPFPSEYQVEAL